MKAIMDDHKIINKTDFDLIKLGSNENSQDIKIVNYIEKPEQGQFIISLYSLLFSSNQLNVFMRGNKIVLFITEIVDSSKTETRYVSDWQSFYPKSYTRMRSVSIILPGDNFFLLRHFLVPDEYLLNIILGQIIEN